MKHILLILMIGFIVPTGLNAQRVYKDVNDKFILDMTLAAGMPAGAVTNVPKKWSGTPANSSSMLTNNLSNGSINATVFQKLEIAPKNINNAGAIGDTGTFTMDWATAYNRCKNSAYDGGNWRLPTQRELMMIWIFRDAFVDLGITDFYTYYWSATEESGSASWIVIFTNGYTTYLSKTTSYVEARCVREL